MNAGSFLRFYHNAVLSLPRLNGSAEGYLAALTPFQTETFYTLLPFGASVKAARNAAQFADVLEYTQRCAAALIEKVLAAP